MRKSFFFIISLLFLLSSCREKNLNTLFLDPLERNKEGYVDQNTFQVLAEATAFDISEFDNNRSKYLPLDIKGDFDQQALDDYNAELKEKKLSKRKIRKLPLNERPLKYLRVLETRVENIPDEALALSDLDKRLKLAATLNKRFFNQACRHALVRALYRWYVISAPQAISAPYLNWESNLASYRRVKKKDKVEPAKKSDLPLLTDFSSLNFPPKIYFSQEKQRLKYLSERLDKEDFSYEIIDEAQHDPAYFSCKVAIHIKKYDILFTYRHLSN